MWQGQIDGQKGIRLLEAACHNWWVNFQDFFHDWFDICLQAWRQTQVTGETGDDGALLHSSLSCCVPSDDTLCIVSALCQSASSSSYTNRYYVSHISQTASCWKISWCSMMFCGLLIKIYIKSCNRGKWGDRNFYWYAPNTHLFQPKWVFFQRRGWSGDFFKFFIVLSFTKSKVLSSNFCHFRQTRKQTEIL